MTLSFLRPLGILCLLATLLTGCYQAHSDDDLRTVPVTNNPQITPSGSRSNPSGIGY